MQLLIFFFLPPEKTSSLLSTQNMHKLQTKFQDVTYVSSVSAVLSEVTVMHMSNIQMWFSSSKLHSVCLYGTSLDVLEHVWAFKI